MSIERKVVRNLSVEGRTTWTCPKLVCPAIAANARATERSTPEAGKTSVTPFLLGSTIMMNDSALSIPGFF